MYLEYFGVENSPGYDERTRYKLKAYRENDIAVVPVYPPHLRSDLARTVIDGVRHVLGERLGDLDQRLRYAPPRTRTGPDSFSLYSRR